MNIKNLYLSIVYSNVFRSSKILWYVSSGRWVTFSNPVGTKVKNSEFIVVGKVLPDMALEVDKIIKGNLNLQQSKLQLDKQDSCFQQSSANQVFFLATDRHHDLFGLCRIK